MTLVQLVAALGADLSKDCETCGVPLSRHEDGEMLFCFTVYAGRSAISKGVGRQLERVKRRELRRRRRK